MRGKNIGARPFIRWQGAKNQYLRILTQALPADFASTPDITYIEPFVGSGSLMFHLLQTYPNISRVIINDNNLDLMRVYNTVRDRTAELIAELKQIQRQFLSLDEDGRNTYFNDRRAEFSERLVDGIRHAALFIFLNKTSVGGLGQKLHVTRHYDICEEAVLTADAKLLADATIMCEDYEKTYNEACGNTFFYLDPPFQSGSKNATTWNNREQVRLKKFCDLLNFRHFDWMLTNNDCHGRQATDTFMEQLYSNYDIQRIWSRQETVTTPEKREKQSELLVRNFDREILSLRSLQCTQLSFAF